MFKGDYDSLPSSGKPKKGPPGASVGDMIKYIVYAFGIALLLGTFILGIISVVKLYNTGSVMEAVVQEIYNPPASLPGFCSGASTPVSAQGVVPTVCSSNPSCAALGFQYGFKLDSGDLTNGVHYFTDADGQLESGTTANPFASVTATFTSGGKVLAFTVSGVTLDAVIMKAGTDANVYRYNPPSISSDSGLAGPQNARFQISHASFCFHYELLANKTVSAGYTTTHTWTIDKSVTNPTKSLLVGTSEPSDYEIILDKTSVSNGAVASGTITIQNPSPTAVTFSVTDVLTPGGLNMVVTCPSLTVNAFSVVLCTYTSSPTYDNSFALLTSTTSNQATVSTPPASTVYNAKPVIVPFVWIETVVGFPSVTVTDVATSPMASTQSWNVNADQTLTYTRQFNCPTTANLYDSNGQYNYTVGNTATITQTSQQSSESVLTKCYAPVVSKSCQTSYTRTYTWDLQKFVNQSSFAGFANATFTAEYLIRALRTTTDSAFLVACSVNVKNPHPSLPMNNLPLQDSITGPAAISSNPVSTTVSVAAATTVSVPINFQVTSATNGTNTASVSLNGYTGTSTAPVIFGAPTTVVGTPTVTITDPLVEANVEEYVSGTNLTYPYPFSCPSRSSGLYNSSGLYTYTITNTATIEETSETESTTITVTCTLPASARVIKTFVDGEEAIGTESLTFRLGKGVSIAAALLNTVSTITLTVDEIKDLGGVLAFDYEIKENAVYTVTEVAASGWFVKPSPAQCNFLVTFPASADAIFSCNLQNTEAGRIRVNKTTDGVIDPSFNWTFTLYNGPYGFGSTPLATGIPDENGLIDFGNLNLDPNRNYTICESGVPSGWESNWVRHLVWTDLNEDGITQPEEIGVTSDELPLEETDVPVATYNPNAFSNPPENLGNICFDISNSTFLLDILAGQTLTFSVDNVRPPGGGQRTPGYWKNWNRCTGGRQAQNADRNGGSANGFWLLEDVLPIVWDDIFNNDTMTFNISTCTRAVAVLDSRDFNNNKKMASDAAYTLARALLATQANFAAGASTCAQIDAAAVEGESILDAVNFTGVGSYFSGGSMAIYRTRALAVAALLDKYNNGLVC